MFVVDGGGRKYRIWKVGAVRRERYVSCTSNGPESAGEWCAYPWDLRQEGGQAKSSDGLWGCTSGEDVFEENQLESHPPVGSLEVK